jgi:polyhydroxyalkanoate synthesis regulator phasin
MLETLERLVLLQIGAAAATREKIEEIVNHLIEQGRIEREEGRMVVEDMLSRARERSAGARALIDTSVQQSLRGAGVPNREAYEDLLFRIEQLEHRVRLLEDRPVLPTEPTVAEPSSPTPPVSGADVSPQPPRDEPDIPPDLRPGGV